MEKGSTKKIIGVITARMSSTRLPGKVMLKICGKSVFALHVERMRGVSGISDIYLATSKDRSNKVLIEESKRLKIKYYRGCEEDILERHISIMNKEKADAALRITCDMPLFDVSSLSRFVEIFKKEYYDYLYVADPVRVQGTTGELISRKAMIRAGKGYRGPAIAQPIIEHMESYKTLGIDIHRELSRPEYRLTLDYPEDFEVITFIYEKLYKGKSISLYDVYKLLDDNPHIAQINKNLKIKGVNIYSANLLDTPKYSIVKSGNKYVILNGNKSSVSLEEFLKELKVMFPRFKGIKLINL